MCLYKIIPFYGSVFSILSRSLHVYALSQKIRISWEGYIVYDYSKATVFHGLFLLLAYLFIILAGQGANSIMDSVLKQCPGVI